MLFKSESLHEPPYDATAYSTSHPLNPSRPDDSGRDLGPGDGDLNLGQGLPQKRAWRGGRRGRVYFHPAIHKRCCENIRASHAHE